ncbi:MAG: hypothetical protein US67_C0049G0002 [Candidatus Woesebacteria bacterium GW2011_GWD1_38_10]|uniref:Glycosyltransferase RgtA/B/C/D-like domain-containing protein n=1 Tax=Candidatus Woesebacteria bacterium GW2011_GWD1_38_10 TaxID=1618592 RepID=A0A0G0HWY6_9BACT|nr:MAG: hypothetical protein US67_C0049G0002 [Candidatus Woesebacteria bacterium GW2011_GWD1_38_10]
MKKYWIILLILLLIIINFKDTLRFSLTGDDLGALYYYYAHFTNRFTYFNLSRYLGNYDASHIIMGEISKLFGFNPLPYYALSMVARTVASISFIPVIKKLTNNTSAAYLSAILFSVMYTGVESTNWVFNMTTYLSIGVFNLFLFVFNFRNKKIFNKHLMLSMLLMFTVFFVTPIRMHGVIITIPLMLLLLGKIYDERVNITRIIIHSIFLIAPVLIFNLSTASQFNNNYLKLASNLTSLQLSNFFLPFSHIGSALLPNKIIFLFFKNISRPDIVAPNTFPIYSLFMLTILSFFTVILKYLLNHNKFVKPTIIATTIFYLTLWLALLYDKTGLYNNLVVLLDTLIGIWVSSLYFFFFLYIFKTDKNRGYTGLYFLTLSITFILIPWLVFPQGIMPSDSRYLLAPGAYLIVCTTLILSYLEKRSKILFLYIYTVIFLIINIYSLQEYFHENILNGRLQNDHLRVAGVINDEVASLDNEKVSVFLFTGPDDGYIYNTIRFGFPYYMLLKHPELRFNAKTAPFAVDNFESLKQVYQNPQSSEIIRYGYEGFNINADQIYSFNIDRSFVINTTLDTRKIISP